jgi:hypothetical protein
MYLGGCSWPAQQEGNMPPKGNIQTGDWVAEFDLPVDTAIHASGDLLADALEVEHFVKPNGCSIIESVSVVDYDDQGANFSLLFFSEDPGSLGALNAAMAISDEKAAKCKGFVTISSWLDIGGQQLGTELNKKGLELRPTDGGTSIWVAAISAGTGTYVTAKLSIAIGLLRG